MNTKNILSETATFIKHHRHLSMVIGTAILLILLLIIGRGILHQNKFQNNETATILIPCDATFDDLVDSLKTNQCIDDEGMFRSMAKMRHLNKHVKGGRYVFEPGTSTLSAVKKLYAGNQDAMRITINKHRTKQHLCDFMASKLEMSSDDLLTVLNDSAICANHGFSTHTIIAMFIQNTYDIYWNIGPEKLLDRMEKEYNRFWTSVRKGQCTDIGLTPIEVITLASIVEEETNDNNEKPLIASVYLNRLHKGMLLQADPTLKYAAGDFTIRRLLNKHIAIDNPYNTYRYKGLPPGPICIPSIASIDAVLENHYSDYLFFCAKEDMSGRHNFARNATEHAANAARFHQALNKKGIF